MSVARHTDPSVVYRGLIIQINGVFELFVKHLSAAVLEHWQSKSSKYSDLDHRIRSAHTVYSATTLSRLNDGQINGVSYDFSTLQMHLGECFTDAEDYRLNTDVFTLQLGNCTPDRLVKLFDLLKIGAPFDDVTGRNQAVRQWSKGLSPRRAAKAAEDELTRQLSMRNEIAHGFALIRDVVPLDVEDACQFYAALIDAFMEKARSLIGVAV
jgi:hypothetical protein